MPTTTPSATPDLDAFLRLHDDDTVLPGGTVGASAGAAGLCWMCWVTPVGAPAHTATGR